MQCSTQLTEEKPETRTARIAHSIGVRGKRMTVEMWTAQEKAVCGYSEVHRRLFAQHSRGVRLWNQSRFF